MMPAIRKDVSSPIEVLNDARALRRSVTHVEIPDSAVPFFADGAAAMPAWGIGNQVTLATQLIPIGWEGLLLDVMNCTQGDAGTFIQGSGDVVWTIDIDTPLTGGALPTGRLLPGYALIQRSLGDLTKPWPVGGTWSHLYRKGWKMKAGETWRYKVYSVANVAVGAPCFAFGSLLGLMWATC